MKRENLEDKISKQAAKFRMRAHRDAYDKRHDGILRDEEKEMYRAYDQLNWSFSQIGRLFDRDTRQVRRRIEAIQRSKEVEKRRQGQEDIDQLAHLRQLKTFLISSVTDSFRTSTPSEVMEWAIQFLESPVFPIHSRAGWESIPNASKVRDHCPDHHLWQDIDEWKQRRKEYYQSIYEIGKRLQTDFREGLSFRVGEIASTKQEQCLIHIIFSWLTQRSISGMLQRVHLPSVQQVKGSSTRYSLISGDLALAEGSRNQIEQAANVEKDMLKRWQDSDDVQSIVHLYFALDVLSQKIQDAINSVDEEVLSKGTCPDCPYRRLEPHSDD